jgi:2-oxoglutarate ferredoxin oxidoreductase subunit beta
MPALATGANAANGELIYIGISGDGDSLSIGLGHLCHAISAQRQPALCPREQRRLRALTKGQFSASADRGSKAKKGEANAYEPIDGALAGAHARASFVARSFSGDKGQLVPILKAAIATRASPSSTSSRPA